MPVSPEQVSRTNRQETAWSKHAVIEIDKRLQDPQYLKDWVCNKEKNPTYRIPIPGEASYGDKKFIIKAYQDAGWGGVKVINSGENGERPGMVLVIISRYLDNN